jgi:hypothetical protein
MARVAKTAQSFSGAKQISTVADGAAGAEESEAPKSSKKQTASRI